MGVFEVFAGGIVISGVVAFLGNSPEIENLGPANLSAGVLFMLLWWIGWTVGGGFGLYAFLWQLIGKENIEVTQEGIKLQNAIFSLGQTKEYLASHIYELRVSSPGMNDMFAVWRTSQFWGTSGGFLAFDYGSKTFHFGSGADEAEAKRILKKILARFPQYASHTPETK